MNIEKDEFEKAKKQFVSKAKNSTCPYCGKSASIELYNELFYEMGPGSEDETRADFNKGVRIPCLCGCCLCCGYILKFRIDRLLG